MIGGVCAGIAGHFGWSVTGARVAYVLLSIVSAAFPGILVYLILWLLLLCASFLVFLFFLPLGTETGNGPLWPL